MEKYNAKSKWKLSGYKIQYDTHTNHYMFQTKRYV